MSLCNLEYCIEEFWTPFAQCSREALHDELQVPPSTIPDGAMIRVFSEGHHCAVFGMLKEGRIFQCPALHELSKHETRFKKVLRQYGYNWFRFWIEIGSVDRRQSSVYRMFICQHSGIDLKRALWDLVQHCMEIEFRYAYDSTTVHQRWLILNPAERNVVNQIQDFLAGGDIRPTSIASAYSEVIARSTDTTRGLRDILYAYASFLANHHGYYNLPGVMDSILRYHIREDQRLSAVYINQYYERMIIERVRLQDIVGSIAR